MKRLIASFLLCFLLLRYSQCQLLLPTLENRHQALFLSESSLTTRETLVLFECINSMKTEKFQGIKREPHEFCTILQHGFQPLIGALSSLSKKFKVCLKMPLTVTIKELVH